MTAENDVVLAEGRYLRLIRRNTANLNSDVVPLTFALSPAEARPAITHDDGRQRWTI